MSPLRIVLGSAALVLAAASCTAPPRGEVVELVARNADAEVGDRIGAFRNRGSKKK